MQNDKLNREQLTKSLDHHKHALWDFLNYAYANSDKKHSIEAKAERLLIQISDWAKNEYDERVSRSNKKVDWEAVHEDRDKGMTLADIARKYGVSPGTVSQHFITMKKKEP